MAKQATLADALAQHKKASEERERKQALLKVAASWVRARKSGDVELVKAASANLAAAITSLTMEKQAAIGARVRKVAGRATGAARGKKQRTKAANLLGGAATSGPSVGLGVPAVARKAQAGLESLRKNPVIGKLLGSGAIAGGPQVASGLGSIVDRLRAALSKGPAKIEEKQARVEVLAQLFKV